VQHRFHSFDEFCAREALRAMCWLSWQMGIAISLWDEKGPVARSGFHEPVKIGI